MWSALPINATLKSEQVALIRDSVGGYESSHPLENLSGGPNRHTSHRHLPTKLQPCFQRQSSSACPSDFLSSATSIQLTRISFTFTTCVCYQQLALKKHYDRYMWERGTNHVKTEWEQARKVEAAEKQRQYEEWLRQEVGRIAHHLFLFTGMVTTNLSWHLYISSVCDSISNCESFRRDRANSALPHTRHQASIEVR